MESSNATSVSSSRNHRPRSATPPPALGTSTPAVNPLLHTMTDLQQQLYKAQGNLARCRGQLAASKDELSTVQQQLLAVEGDLAATQAEKQDALDRLRQCQEQLERARRDAADGALANVALTAERDDLASSVHQAWDKVASLQRQLAEREARPGPGPATPPAPPADGTQEDGQATAVALALAQAVPHREWEALRARCEELEQAQSANAHRLQRAAEGGRKVLGAVAALIENVRRVHVRRLLPLDKVAHTPTTSITEVDRRNALEELDGLESRLSSFFASPDLAAAACRPISRAVRALMELFDTLHEDALRLAADRAQASREREAAHTRAERAKAELLQVRNENEAMQRAVAEQHEARKRGATAQERESHAACRSLAATLNCVEDWAMVKHRVQHLQQQAAAWEREVNHARQQLSSLRAESEATLHKQAAQLRSERLAISEENRKLSRELAALRDEHAALQLEHEYGTQAGQAAAAVAAGSQHALAVQTSAVTAELDKLRREHTSLQAAYKEALRCAEEELMPFAEEQESKARKARSQADQLAQDNERLRSTIDILRSQLYQAGGEADATAAVGKTEGSVAESGQGRPRATRNRHHQERERSKVPLADHSRDAHGDGHRAVASAAPPAYQYPHRPPAAAGPLPLAYTYAAAGGRAPPPYPAPVLPTPSRERVSDKEEEESKEKGELVVVADDTKTAQTHQQVEESLHRSIQEDYREAAYQLGRRKEEDGASRGVVPTRRPDPSSNKFAIEVLGVIEALDRKVTGALQRHERVEA